MVSTLDRDRQHGAQAERGSVSPLEEHADWILALIAKQPDLTLEEILTAMAKQASRAAGALPSFWRTWAFSPTR